MKLKKMKLKKHLIILILQALAQSKPRT